jgi:hypothetical protein
LRFGKISLFWAQYPAFRSTLPECSAEGGSEILNSMSISSSPTSADSLDPQRVLESLVNAAYAKAKYWAGFVLALQVIVFVVGVIAVFEPKVSVAYPWIALPLALVGVWLAACATRYKSMAEALKRQHEHLAGFGRKPAGRLLASLRVELPDELRPQLDQLLREGITYASVKPFGPTRVLENLCESAWFSQHLAGYCAKWLRAVFVITLVIAVALLLLCAITLTGTSVGVAAAKCVSATLLFLISVGILRAWLSYHRFSQKSEQIDGEASRLLAGAEPDSCDAQRLLAEYQLTRASAPLIPTWVWRIRRDHLNKNWALRSPTN